MKRIGITGQQGFIGYHLYQTLKLYPEHYQLVEYSRAFFENESLLDEFVAQADVIVHLAAVNRHHDKDSLFDTNLDLVRKLIASLKRTKSKAHVIMSSSTQEERDNPYGQSKKAGRSLLSSWSIANDNAFTGLIIPNVFGPFGKPYYNSVVATFSHQLTHGEVPQVDNDAQLKLIYVGEVVDEIISSIDSAENQHEKYLAPTAEASVREILEKLEYFKGLYFDKGEIPQLNCSFDLQLFNTFRSYIELTTYFSKKFKLHKDERGSFVEILRMKNGGQFSFSSTHPGITRGNHFHTRKIERFAVISGKARIQLRRVGTDEVHEFYLDGSEPAYVDMPIWCTHSITNVGTETLFTNFWINEPFDQSDPDTWLEVVKS